MEMPDPAVGVGHLLFYLGFPENCNIEVPHPDLRFGGPPMIINFFEGCRSGHSSFDLMMEAEIMKYMLLVYLDEKALTESEREHCYIESAQLTQDLNARGQYLSAGPLHPISTATSVRIRDNRRLVTDGPFAETREQLGGYYLIDAKNLDEAIGIAERIPVARVGTIEIRPVLEIPGLPG